MIILPQKILTTWNPSTKKYYESKGYKFTKMRDKFYVDVLDLPSKSDAKITVLCDYCIENGIETMMEKSYYNYSYARSITEKDCCKSCKSIKTEESNFKKYGVKSPIQNDQIKKKIIETNIEKFGVHNPTLNKEVREKQVATLSKNGNGKCSSQQRLIHDSIGGKLNYPFGNLLLDIAFPDDKIYVEYDGSGHDLSVQLGFVSHDAFNKNEINRSYFLSSKGWREIRFISNSDKIPDNETLVKMFNFAKNYLSNGHTWIKFYLDEEKIVSNCFTNDFKEVV